VFYKHSNWHAVNLLTEKAQHFATVTANVWITEFDNSKIQNLLTQITISVEQFSCIDAKPRQFFATYLQMSTLSA